MPDNMFDRLLNKAEALALLKERREHPPTKIDNASLHAGSPMYYYCRSCGWESDIKPEGWFLGKPKTLCDMCQYMADCGYLE